jgi:malonyl-CoA O-methyltransferase
MFDTRAVKADFSQAAKGYDAHAQLQQQVRAKARTLAEGQWPQGALVLDVGAGTGAFGVEAKAQGWQVLNLDMAFGMCQQVKAMPAVCAAAEALPVIRGCADGVFSNLMLQWCATPQSAFAEMARVLKAEGSVVLTTFTHGTLAELAGAFAGVDGFSHVSPFFTPQQLVQAAQKAGLSCLHMEEETRLQHYDSLAGLMRGLKAIGAVNKEAGRRRSLMTPRQMARVEDAYRQHSGGGLPASWQVLYLVLGRH